jgi:hypothetical protein
MGVNIERGGGKGERRAKGGSGVSKKKMRK